MLCTRVQQEWNESTGDPEDEARDAGISRRIQVAGIRVHWSWRCPITRITCTSIHYIRPKSLWIPYTPSINGRVSVRKREIILTSSPPACCNWSIEIFNYFTICLGVFGYLSILVLVDSHPFLLKSLFLSYYHHQQLMHNGFHLLASLVTLTMAPWLADWIHITMTLPEKCTPLMNPLFSFVVSPTMALDLMLTFGLVILLVLTHLASLFPTKKDRESIIFFPHFILPLSFSCSLLNLSRFIIIISRYVTDHQAINAWPTLSNGDKSLC